MGEKSESESQKEGGGMLGGRQMVGRTREEAFFGFKIFKDGFD
jgi:hypothetical protein